MSDESTPPKALRESLAPPQDSLTSNQDRKLQLEIDKLELEKKNLSKKNRWESLSPFVPIFASLVTMAALVIGFVQFQRQQETQQNKTNEEQRQKRVTQLEDQMRSDGNEISRFTRDPSQTLSRLSYLLDDMKRLMEAAAKIRNEQSTN